MIKKIDHAVITTTDVKNCIAFYKALGFKASETQGRWELFDGDFKINVHIKGWELEPKAKYVHPGSADICFEIDVPIEQCYDCLLEKGLKIELGIVSRYGAKGNMRSIYLRDPDGNLIELCSYD